MDIAYSYDCQVKEVVKGLSQLRKENLLCDAVLESADGEKFPVHRNVLAAASTYFKAMFCRGFNESESQKESPIVLQSVKSVGLEAALDFVYSGELTLSEECIVDVLAAAHMFELPVIIHTCTEYLIEHMSTITCFKYLNAAESYFLPDVTTAAERLIVNMFVELSITNEFKEMKKETLCRYLKDDNLKGEEIDIYRAAMRWLDHDPSRTQYLTEVMTNINFRAIPAKTIASEIMKVDSFKYNKECFEMAMSAIVYHTHPYSQPLSGVLDHYRGEEIVLLIEDGELESKDGFTTSTPNKISLYRKSDIRLAYERDGDEVLECIEETLDLRLIETSINAVTVGNFLYLFGTDCDTYNAVTKRLDGSTRIWLNLAPIPRNAAVASTAARIGDSIVIVGGMVVNKRSKRERDAAQFVNSTLSYSVRNNQWSRMACFPSRIAYAASCSHDDILYVAGGNVQKQDLAAGETDSVFYSSRKLFAYDHDENAWLAKADMKQGRSESIFEAVEEKLFLLGGCRYEDDESVPSIEMYSIAQNQWSIIEKNPGFPYDSAVAYVDGDRIVVLGGYNYVDDSATSHISIFSTKQRNPPLVSTLNTKLKNIMCQHTCVLLKMTT